MVTVWSYTNASGAREWAVQAAAQDTLVVSNDSAEVNLILSCVPNDQSINFKPAGQMPD